MSRRANGRRARKVGTRPRRRRLLIVCEGSKTEPNYFRSFRVNAEVVIRGDGRNTVSLVEDAISYAATEGPFDSRWVVFDKDDFTAEQFNAAVAKAEAKGFRAAWSNQSFELWFLLHFSFVTSALHRDQICHKLGELLGSKYDKSSAKHISRLDDLLPVALANAKKLAARYAASTPPADRDPCTMVFRLVEELQAAAAP